MQQEIAGGPVGARWVDAVVKSAAAESGENARRLSTWFADWAGRATEAARPLAEHVLGTAGKAAVEDATDKLMTRAVGLGIKV